MEHITPAPVPHNAKAVIALTSWKKRISTVGMTIFNLMRVCGPKYHIVLTLAKDEFPRMESELPKDLKLFIKTGLLEILWVQTNWRSFKKWIFTSVRYPTVPIISADDDCLYKYNFADELYSHITSPKTCVTYWCDRFKHTPYYNTAGYATCYSPNYFGDVRKYLTKQLLDKYNEDDMLYVALRCILNIPGCVCLNKSYNDVAVTHHEVEPLHNLYKGRTRQERDSMIESMIQLLEQ